MDIIIDFQKLDTLKIQLKFAIKYFSSVVSEKERVIHSRSDTIKLTS